MKLSLISLIFILISCREIKEAPKQEVVLGLNNFVIQEFPYVGDESLDVFLLHPWYTYDENNHIIWPNFQVYALKTKGKYYKLQVADYYDDNSAPGNYTLRIEPQGEGAFDWDFQAQGCGNVYTNLSYKECLKDPSRNVYTYLSIEARNSWQMSDQEALLDASWDIAFNGTEVKLNSGVNGLGDARIGDLYLYQPFFNGEVADFQRIAEVSFADKGERFFNLDLDLQSVALSLPQGIDRAIYEDDWFREMDDGSFSAVDTSWWMLWGGEEQSFFKFRVARIEEERVEENILSKISIEYYQQINGESRFEEELREWTLPVLSSAKRSTRWCLNFETQEIIPCSNIDWDLSFRASSRRGKRRWRFNVKRGAIGPLSKEDMLGRRSALPPFL